MENKNRRVKLKEVCQTTSGGTPSRNVVSFYNGNIPWVKSGELRDGFIAQTEESITENGVKNSSAKVFPAGTLLIALYGATVGRLGILEISAATNQAVCAIFPSNKVNRDYLFYCLLKQREKLIDSRTGGAQPNISQDIIRELEIPLPPLPEQRRIAALLSQADRLRRLRRYADQLGGSYLQSVFVEMFGEPFTNPRGWTIEDMGEHIASIRYGTGSPPGYQEKGIPFIRATNIKQGTVQEEGLVFISEKDAQRISKCKIKAGDLIVVRSGINVGDCGLIPSKYDGAYAAYDLIVEVPHPTNCFINFLINSPYGKAIVDTLSRRAGQPHINAEQVESIKFPFPPLYMQERFAAVVARYEHLRLQQREAGRQAELLFQSLLSQAFSGEN